MQTASNSIISIIAHDLKDPLTSISGIAEVLKNNWNEFSEEEKIDIVNEIRDVSDTTLRLLSDLLDWSKKTTEVSKPDKKPFKAREITDSITDSSRLKEKWNKIKVLNDVSADIVLLADENMFSAVIRNLLANAVKSCPQGGKIEINAEVKGKMCEFCISDNGVGMTESRIDYLFPRENEDMDQRSGTSGNTGFGLVLCKDFVRINGGEIRAESRQGKETRVYFTVPCQRLSSPTGKEGPS